MDRYECADIWVKKAGERLRSLVRDSRISFTEKSGHNDIVTAYDKELEQYLRGEISRAFPGDRIVGEEFPATGEAGIGAAWYLDPIDGTNNFVSQRCNYAICVGCADPDGPDFGFVLDVEAGQLYCAKTGGGAWQNGRPIHTQDTRDVHQMLLTFPSVADAYLRENPYGDGIARLSLDVRAVRSLGSVALELCQVASGRMDLCVAMRSNPWDHNAARVILVEAGGSICSLDGSPLPYDRAGGFVAGNSEAAMRQAVLYLEKK